MKLRIGILLVAVMAVGASPSYAQAPLGGGVKVGVNFANLTAEDEEDIEPDFERKTGLVVGAFVDVGINDSISFQPEFLFTQKGAKFSDPEISGGTVEAKLRLDMFQIPALLKVAVPTEGGVRPFFVVGPGFGFRTTAKLEVEDEEEDIKDDVATVEVSGIIGAGLQFGRGMVEVRYDHGFTDLDDESDTSEVKTRTFSILFGIGFGR